MTEQTISVGADAPDFDLTSTEDVLLMLRDEVPRTPVILYVFLEIDDAAREDLEELAAAVPKWTESGLRVLAMAPVKVARLKQLQAELELPFPLLEDDRDFCERYGVSSESTDRRLVVIDRHSKVHWHSDQWSGLKQALAEVKRSRPDKQPRLINYPGQVVNKLVNWWVN